MAISNSNPGLHPANELAAVAAKLSGNAGKKSNAPICSRGAKKERAGFASGPKALGNGGVSSREDAGILTSLG